MIREELIYGELSMSDEKRQRGESFVFDAAKGLGRFVGTAQIRVTTTGQGAAKVCRFEFPIELDSVTPDRITGQIRMGDGFDYSTCSSPGERLWREMSWVRVQ